jgi:predicted O-methyltransferase YrrM
MEKGKSMNNDIWAKAKEYKIQQLESEFMEALKNIPEGAVGMEIGCYSGGTTIAFSMKCSKLVSLDLSKIFDTTEVQKNCDHTFFEGDSKNPAIVDSINRFFGEAECLDFLFIDGDHTAAGARQDYFTYKHLVKRGGVIFFHDIVDSESHRNQNCMVSTVWAEVKELHDFKEFVQGEDWGGIGMITI